MTSTPAKEITYRNHVGGAWTASASGKSVANVNPADTRDVVGHVPLSTADEAREAVAAARAAFPSWRDTPAPKRGAVLYRAMALLDQEKDAIARLLTREEGKTVGEALGEVQRAINVLEFTAAEGRRLGGRTIPSELPWNFCYTLRQPLGVVACITPWNFPVAIPIWKIAPALVCGNTVVLKPATLTPACAAALVSIFERAGLPAGVLNLVFGSGGVVGDALLDHPDVAAISFTGSNAVGTAVYAQGARRLARVQCEMGGKNPVVVMADADLDLAVEATAQGAFGSTGQRCTATSRVIVDVSVADDFVERLAARASRIRVGPGLDGADMGPAVDAAQLETDLRYVDRGREEGARLVQGGERLTGRRPGPRLFHPAGHLRPREPVDADRPGGDLRPRGERDPRGRVRGGPRGGQRGAVRPRRLDLQLRRHDTQRFVDGIEAGIVHINSGTPGGEAQLPFGGSKATGVGPGSRAPRRWTSTRRSRPSMWTIRDNLGRRASTSLAAVILLFAVVGQARGQEAPIIVYFADGSNVPLSAWSFSYDYEALRKDAAPAFGSSSARESRHIFSGKKSLPTEGAVLEIQYREFEEQRQVEGGETRNVKVGVATGFVLTSEGKSRDVRARSSPRGSADPRGGGEGRDRAGPRHRSPGHDVDRREAQLLPRRLRLQRAMPPRAFRTHRQGRVPTVRV